MTGLILGPYRAICRHTDPLGLLPGTFTSTRLSALSPKPRKAAQRQRGALGLRFSVAHQNGRGRVAGQLSRTFARGI